jgi:hypothetical protein
LTVVDLNALETISQTPIPLADNVATSGNDEFFVSSGESGLFRRFGIDAFVLEPGGTLVRTKTFFLGINRCTSNVGVPKNDQIRRIVFKPGVSQIGVGFGLLRATGEDGYAFLSWHTPVAVPPSSFVILRAESIEETPIKLSVIVSPGSDLSFSCSDYSVIPGNTYWYWVRFVGQSGEGSYGPICVHVASVPAAYALYQNYPNPFNPVCTLKYVTPRAGKVTLRIFNVDGSAVRTLVDGWRETGTQSAVWDGKDEQGRQVPSGVYFYRLKAGDFVATRKMVLLR